MKKLGFLIILTLAFISNFNLKVNAQTTKKPSASEKITINKKGEIYDHGWNKLGYITKDNIVKDNEGKTIYFIDNDGNVIDAQGQKLGKAQKNGNFYNLEGENVITLEDKNAEMCKILDPSGHNLGMVHKNYKLHACAAHCLALVRKKQQNTPQ